MENIIYYNPGEKLFFSPLTETIPQLPSDYLDCSYGAKCHYTNDILWKIISVFQCLNTLRHNYYLKE